MRLFNYHIPCGCEARKEIMFVKGQPGMLEAGILAVAAAMFLVARRLGRS